MSAPTIAIVVVNYDSHELVDQNFGDLDLSELNAQLYVVDNFSSQSERAAITNVCQRRDRWTLVAIDGNIGFGAGVNRGVAAAQADEPDCLLIVNPDLILTAPTALTLAQDVVRDPSVVASPVINRPDGRPWFRGGFLDLRDGSVRTSREVDMADPQSWLTGACLALAPSMWRAAGGFAETYFMYWEDIDFSQRCRAQGAVLSVRPDLVVVHEVGATQGAGKSPLYTYYNCRNRLLYASRWLPATRQRQWVRATPRRSCEILLRGGRKALLDWQQVRSAVSGSLTGCRYVRKSVKKLRGASR